MRTDVANARTRGVVAEATERAIKTSDLVNRAAFRHAIDGHGDQAAMQNAYAKRRPAAQPSPGDPQAYLRDFDKWVGDATGTIWHRKSRR